MDKSDEEDGSCSSPEEGFSASEDEWKPSKEMRGGESSDDDDSDFESSPTVGVVGGAGTAASSKKKEPKGRSATKQQAVRKRKSTGQSLRSKLYNKYKPPPKTFPGRGNSSSPSASTSSALTASKNAEAPNDGKGHDDENDNNSSSDSSVEDYLVNPAELDLQSSFFDVGFKSKAGPTTATSPAPPQFDCNAGMNLSDSGSEDNNETSGDEGVGKAFDFRNLLENASSLDRVKETIAKRAANASASEQQEGAAAHNNTAAMDVGSLLALGENQNANVSEEPLEIKGRQKLRQSKSTRQKRHTKPRPAAGVDSEDSDWEEVADNNHTLSDDTGADGSLQHDSSTPSHDFSRTGSLEIHVEFPNRQRAKDRKQQDLDAVLKRKLNRDIKERQLLLHKTSLLCCFARNYVYNRLLNDTSLMQEALKLLPSKNSYPPDRGTEIKYYQSLVSWFKTAISLKSDHSYPMKCGKNKDKVKQRLIEQIKKKEAHSKQDMVFLFVILLRGMGLQCRLVVNMQPMPLRPPQSDLHVIKLKKEDANDGNTKVDTTSKCEETCEEDSKVTSKLEKESVREKHKTESKPVCSKSKDKEVVSKKESTKSGLKGKLNKTNSSEQVEEQKLNEKKPKLELNKSEDAEHLKRKDSEEKMSAASRSKEVRTRQDDKASTSKVVKTSNLDKSGDKLVDIPVKRPNASVKKELDISKDANSKRQKFADSHSKDSSQTHSKERSFEESLQITKPTLSKLKRVPVKGEVATKKAKLSDALEFTPIGRRTRLASNDKSHLSKTSEQKPVFEVGSPVIPKIVVHGGNESTMNSQTCAEEPSTSNKAAPVRSRSKSPKCYISTEFLQTKVFKEKFSANNEQSKVKKMERARSKSPNEKVKISTEFLKGNSTRVLRSRQKPEEVKEAKQVQIPQLDGADDSLEDVPLNARRKPLLRKLQKSLPPTSTSEDEDFQPSPTKKPKTAPVMPKAVDRLRKDRRVLSTDDDSESKSGNRNKSAADMWAEVWSDVEEQWICVDLFKGKLHSVESIRKSATSSFAYVYAFQNDLSLKDITARYCPNWTTMVRKARVDKAWLDAAISSYKGRRTKRDIREDQELRRIHEEKPMPTTISDYKDHPLYALERHLLKFQAIYPPDAPTLGFIRGEPVYSRDCVHTLHSREIWLKEARTVRLGEQPYKIVKARPKWDKLTQTVIKDQPLEIFGFWQTQDYEPPTAENGLVPRNAYGNVELFKECMLPKKTVHLRLPGLNRVCKKLGIDCANAVIGFDFHQGACHPAYDGFVVCEEFADTVTAAWYQDQEDQDRKEQEKYEARVYGNWKKLIRGLLIRERLKKKYNF